ncbi:uncharacterized protein LOC134453805 [Engraulis encrasicolus]|uniref:uncharacterized protein LOC134453805 n=1 Tax=Engraulis encrasicolus TaxID=184585 RepID=UPI002FD52F53
MRDKLDILALVLGSLGFICLAYSVLLPRWLVSDSRGIGPWMSWHWGAKGLQCTLHGDILLGMSIPLWIGTALALSAVLMSGFALRGTKCCGVNVQKKLFAGGCLYLLSCWVALGPVIWATYIIGINGFKVTDTGECLYLAWISLGLLLAVGVLQLHRYSPCRRKEEVSHNCTPPLEHEDEEERYGEESVHFLKPETIWERGKQEMVCLNKYERTAGDNVTEPTRKGSKRQYV